MLVGGFLGAGKTTLLLHAAQVLAARGLRVGLVTNDQGHGLVDTALAQAGQWPVVEVAGGCFCCRFPDLLDGLRTLQRTIQPDVILAEPVGSCTDLMATVVRPLHAYAAADYDLAPLTVLLDATRQIEDATQEIRYLYGRQLAEAEVIGLSKADQVEAAAHAELARHLSQTLAPVHVQPLSAHTGAGVAEWLERMLTQTSQRTKSLDVDYAQYAAAEAQLGWLNAQGELTSHQPFGLKNWFTHLLRLLDSALAGQQATIGHIKLQATALNMHLKASLTQTGGAILWDRAEVGEPVMQARFTLNARVHISPITLESIVRHVFAELSPPPTFRYTFTRFACFSPAPPQPTYRMA
jgi:G3E family GTPase